MANYGNSLKIITKLVIQLLKPSPLICVVTPFDLITDFEIIFFNKYYKSLNILLIEKLLCGCRDLKSWF